MPGSRRCGSPANLIRADQGLACSYLLAAQHTVADTGASATPSVPCVGPPGAYTPVMGSMAANVWSTTVLGSPFGPIPIQHPPQPASSPAPASSSTHSFKCGRRCGYTPLGGTRGKPVSVMAVTLRQHPLITGDCVVCMQRALHEGACGSHSGSSSMASWQHGVVLAVEELLT